MGIVQNLSLNKATYDPGEFVIHICQRTLLARDLHKHLPIHIVSVRICAKSTACDVPVLWILAARKDLPNVEVAMVRYCQSSEIEEGQDDYLSSIALPLNRCSEREVKPWAAVEVKGPDEMMCLSFGASIFATGVAASSGDLQDSQQKGDHNSRAAYSLSSCAMAVRMSVKRLRASRPRDGRSGV